MVTVSCVSLQGKKNFSIYLPHHITCIAPLNLKRSRTTNCLIVGLHNGEVRIYNEKSLVSTINIEEPPSGAIVRGLVVVYR